MCHVFDVVRKQESCTLVLQHRTDNYVWHPRTEGLDGASYEEIKLRQLISALSKALHSLLMLESSTVAPAMAALGVAGVLDRGLPRNDTQVNTVIANSFGLPMHRFVDRTSHQIRNNVFSCIMLACEDCAAYGTAQDGWWPGAGSLITCCRDWVDFVRHVVVSTLLLRSWICVGFVG